MAPMEGLGGGMLSAAVRTPSIIRTDLFPLCILQISNRSTTTNIESPLMVCRVRTVEDVRGTDCLSGPHAKLGWLGREASVQSG
jgi:hypothetical protein